MRLLALGGVLLGWMGLTFLYTALVLRRDSRPPTGTNYRGVRLPMYLGLGLLLLGFWVNAFNGRWFLESSVQTGRFDRLMIVASLFLVFLVGLLDDYQGDPAQGIRGHFKELAGGRVTAGTMKLVGIVGSATLVAVSLHGGGLRVLLGIPVIAGAANVWNLLDVRPGRALKWFLLVALVLVGWYARFDDFLLGAAIGSAAGLLAFDLRERAMLGDAGSNVLGFIIGLALFRILPVWGLAVALALILALHALGETVTLSRIIDSALPLRWFDRLGRLPDERTKPESGLGREDRSKT